MPTVHYMKRGFFRRRGLALPHTSLKNMKTSKYKKNKIACTQKTATMPAGRTTPHTQETASQPRHALPATHVPTKTAANQCIKQGVRDTANKTSLVITFCLPIEPNDKTSPDKIIPLSKPPTTSAAFIMPIQPNVKTLSFKNNIVELNKSTTLTSQDISIPSIVTDSQATCKPTSIEPPPSTQQTSISTAAHQA